MSDMRVEDVNGRKRRATKLGIVEAMIRARIERTRAVGESFRVTDGLRDEGRKVEIIGIYVIQSSTDVKVQRSPIDKGMDDKSEGGDERLSHS